MLSMLNIYISFCIMLPSFFLLGVYWRFISSNSFGNLVLYLYANFGTIFSLSILCFPFYKLVCKSPVLFMLNPKWKLEELKKNITSILTWFLIKWVPDLNRLNLIDYNSSLKLWEKNIVVPSNPTDPWRKPPTQKVFQHFWGKTSHMVNFSWFLR